MFSLASSVPIFTAAFKKLLTIPGPCHIITVSVNIRRNMPVIFTEDGFRFFFYSNEGHEPIHVHIEKSGCVAKFWIKPIKLAKNEGFKSKELKRIIEIIFENQLAIEDKWNEHFSK